MRTVITKSQVKSLACIISFSMQRVTITHKCTKPERAHVIATAVFTLTYPKMSDGSFKRWSSIEGCFLMGSSLPINISEHFSSCFYEHA